MSNKLRVLRAAIALDQYEREDPRAERAQHICDLLVDLRHLCDFDSIDFKTIDRMAKLHYQSERG